MIKTYNDVALAIIARVVRWTTNDQEDSASSFKKMVTEIESVLKNVVVCVEQDVGTKQLLDQKGAKG